MTVSLSSNNNTLVIIGGGAAGFFCAINAAMLNPLLRVIVLEKSGKLLSKVKVSGGGRCNVTHACFDVQELSRFYPRGEHFVRKAFHRFNPKDIIQWFEERSVKLKTEADGRMFPVTNSSQTIIDCFLKEADKYKVEVRTNCEVKNISQQENSIWKIDCGDGKTFEAGFVCVACGGFPKLQQAGFLKETKHHIIPPAPSLFTFNIPHHPVTELMGVSVTNATVKVQSTKLKSSGPLLITHWGLSGPCVLKLSAWGARELQQRQYDFTISVNWLGEKRELEVKDELQYLRTAKGNSKISNGNSFQLPGRLWNFLLQMAGIKADWNWADLPSKEQNKLVQLLVNHEFQVKGKTTFKDEFVTAGGIDLKEVDVQTMQSKLHPRLFFAGEMLDVDAVTGGFNFQFAWTSAFVAAQSIALHTY